jgi:hypothetical protein
VSHANPELLIFKDEEANIFVDEDQSPFYPGQHVRATSSFVFRHAKWIRGGWKSKWEGVVVQVEAGEVRSTSLFGDLDGGRFPDLHGMQKVGLMEDWLLVLLLTAG